MTFKDKKQIIIKLFENILLVKTNLKIYIILIIKNCKTTKTIALY